MRAVRFGRVAADAQVILLRRHVRMAARRAAMAAVAAIFALAAFAGLHVLGYAALVQYGGLGRVGSVAIVLGVDCVFATIFGFLASSAGSDRVADEARRLRDESLAQARAALTFTALLGSLLGILARRPQSMASLTRIIARMMQRK